MGGGPAVKGKGKRLAIVLLALAFLLSACMALFSYLQSKGWPFAWEEKLQPGTFPDELSTMCAEIYDLQIPPDAVLVGGVLSNALRESYVEIAFDVPAEALPSDWAALYEESGMDAVTQKELHEKYGRKYASLLVHAGDAFPNERRLFCSAVHDGAVSFCLLAPQS